MLLLSSKKLWLTTAHTHAYARAETGTLITGLEILKNKSYRIYREREVVKWTMECQASEGMLHLVQETDAIMQRGHSRREC